MDFISGIKYYFYLFIVFILSFKSKFRRYKYSTLDFYDCYYFPVFVLGLIIRCYEIRKDIAYIEKSTNKRPMFSELMGDFNHKNVPDSPINDGIILTDKFFDEFLTEGFKSKIKWDKVKKKLKKRK